MKGLIDFIANYYLWIILALAVVFFAYMGYSAEKKGYIGKKKKETDNDLVDIDELIKPKDTKTKKEEKEHEEDLSASFDVMPDVPAAKAPAKEEKPIEEDISEDLYAPFGDQKIEVPAKAGIVDEVEEDNFNQSFVDINKIEKEAKDINNNDNKKDVADLMKSTGNINTDFEVEGASDSLASDNVFEQVAAEEKTTKKKKEEAVDDMWKF